MRRPSSLWEQYAGKAHAELFRGAGLWPLQERPCDLEPPWEPFDRQTLSVWDSIYHNWQVPWEGAWWKRLLFSPTPPLADGKKLELPEVTHTETDQLAHILIARFPEDESTIAKADVFLRSLANLTAPVSFEILGVGAQPIFDPEKAQEFIAAGESKRLSEAIRDWTEPYVKTQFVAHQRDAKQVQHQLLSQYPNSAVLIDNEECDSEDLDIFGDINNADGYAGTLGLRVGYCWTLRQFTKLDTDPLGVILSAMDHLERREWALLQILFQPAQQPWAETLRESLQNPYSGKLWFQDLPPRQLDEKFSTPLFAVTIRLAARTGEIYRHLQGWAEQFAAPPQSFDYLLEDDEASDLASAVLYRTTYRPGMLLNVSELASLVHLPGESIVSERLRRVKTRTRAAPKVNNAGSSVLLGENIHRGITQPAHISAEMRPRHCYLAGASGTGKSTLLLNMILQDINAGHGVGVLDPHGDLIHDVLRRIPEHRIDDVILFDPADDQFPFALNILDASDENERERIVAETIMSLERYFPAAWGPRLERILIHRESWGLVT